MSTPSATSDALVLNPEDFAHLHVHSEYSIADGAIAIKQLVKTAKGFGHKAIALTDHGNLFGAVEFYLAAKEVGIKPIIGAEIYYWGQDDAHKLQAERKPFHMVLLAKNLQGYQNLIKIVSSAYHPAYKDGDPAVIQNDILDAMSGDLIAMSSCQLGELGFLVQEQRRQPDNAQIPELIANYVAKMHKLFPANFYVELVANGLPRQNILLKDLAACAQKHSLPIVATADAHYLTRDDKEAHVIMTGIKNELTESDLMRRTQDYEFHLLSPEEMQKKYATWPEALANIKRIVDQCNVEFSFGEYHLPQFDLGTGEDAPSGLRRLAREGLEERFRSLALINGQEFDDNKKKAYRDRLEYELDTIIDMKFPGYFLIVQDFINWAKDNGIPVGPGRGSGVGSLVAYSLKITDLDPIPYNLVFERFLNPERVSMPDFDVDFCQARRDEVIQYVNKRYGEECVAQIITFGKMLAKAAVRDVGRVLGLGYNRVDQIAKLIPMDLGMTLAKAFVAEPRILEEMEKNSEIRRLLELAQKIEGKTRHTSVHAAGVIISDGPMTNYLPIYRVEGSGQITQFEMTKAEKIGLIKFDFLGLKTLTVIDKATKHIHRLHDSEFNIANIRLDCKEVYDMISKAHTTGIFQLESTGMQQLLAKLKPNTFEDIIAVVALFRPGPLGSGMVDDLIERKHGRQKIDYMLPQLRDVLKDTYGIILYQEQVQKAAAVLANYTLGEADLLRRAMGKKKPEEMQRQKERFVKGCLENGISSESADDIFELMAKFAEYGFNKSHSAAYGLISYQTAYLKVFYPAEFMAAIMSCDMDNTDKIVRYIAELQRMQIKLMPPDINSSFFEFTVPAPKTVGYGLGAIKGFGEASAQEIIQEREANGPFQSLTDLAKRLNLQAFGRKNLELLTQTGALDSFGFSRADLLAFIPGLIRFSENHHAAKDLGQGGLFDDEGDQNSDDDTSLVMPAKKLVVRSSFEELCKEKELLGCFLSGHPLDTYIGDMKKFSNSALNRLTESMGQEIEMVCMPTAFNERRAKSTGKRLMYIVLSDPTGDHEGLMYEADIPATMPELFRPIIAVCSVKKRFGSEADFTLNIRGFKSLEDARIKAVRTLELGLSPEALPIIPELKTRLARVQGATKVNINVNLPAASVKIADTNFSVALDNTLLEYLASQAPHLTYRYVN